jgi:aspartate kinase
MPRRGFGAAPLSVIKIGGSVLTDPAAYRRAAAFVARRLSDHPGERVLAVVSAQHGTTDALERVARDISPRPDRSALDLLWSTGELQSVAILVLCLHALGVDAAAVNVQQTGLVEPDLNDAGSVRLRALRLRALLAAYDVVVAPGFLARGAADSVVSLGRGGSDLTAVLLAAGLQARLCELVKDVPGYFSADPNVDPHARHLPAIDYSRALTMADDGCELVQRHALEAARDYGVTLAIRSMTAGQPHTIVSA